MSLKQDIVFACFVGDAACMPLHWIYERSELVSLIGDDKQANGLLVAPEFFPKPSCPHYNSNPDDKKKGFPGHYEFGSLSPYGETGYVILDYLKKSGGKFEGGEEFCKFQSTWFKNYDGRKDGPTSAMLKAVDQLTEKNQKLYPDCGADDDQAYLTFKLPQLLLKFGDLPESEFLLIVEQAVRSLQNNDITVCWAKCVALLIKFVAEGMKFEAALEKVVVTSDELLDSSQEHLHIKAIKETISFVHTLAEPVDRNDYSQYSGLEETGLPGKVVKCIGLAKEKEKEVISCIYPGNFLVAASIVLQTVRSFGGEDSDAFKKEGFAFGVRRNIIVGGDCCGRNWLISSCLRGLGAELPQTMIDNFTDSGKVQTLLTEISRL